MQLCLSARMFAAERNAFSMSLPEFMDYGKRLGYDGIAIRPGQLDGTMSHDEVDAIALALKDRGLSISFVRGGSLTDVPLEEHHRLIDHVKKLGGRYIEFFVWKEEEIPAIQNICDHAAEHDIVISPQLHNNAMHDTVPRCLDFLKAVDRPNLDINFEAAHLIIQNQDILNGDAVRALADHIGTVCVQNYRMDGDKTVNLLPGDTSGVDFPDVFNALKESGWDGFVTHMAPRHPDVDDETLCRQYVEVLRPFMA